MLRVLSLLTVEGPALAVDRCSAASEPSGRQAWRPRVRVGARGPRFDSHGLFLYFTHLVHDPARYGSPQCRRRQPLFGYPLTSYVIHVAPPIGVHAIQTTSTRCRVMADWTRIAPPLRAGPVIPFHAIGQLFSVSLAVGVIYFAGRGFPVQIRGRRPGQRVVQRLRPAAAVAALAAAAFFIVTSFEYNARTVSRALRLVVALIALTLVEPPETGLAQVTMATLASPARHAPSLALPPDSLPGGCGHPGRPRRGTRVRPIFCRRSK